MSGTLLLFVILIPLIGAFLTATSKYTPNYTINNVHNVVIWVLLTNISLILYIFSLIDITKTGIQLVEKYSWLDILPVDLLLGADTFSLLLLFGINLSFLIAGLSLRKDIDNAKLLSTSELLFIGLLNGYMLASDIISFYIFFAAVSIPLIILISNYGRQYRKNVLIRFSLYNLVGALLLLCAIVIMYNSKSNNIPLNTAGNLNLQKTVEYFVWMSLFIAFMSRMPIWPFHYWISSINSTLRNPIVFVIGNLVPLIGLYGFMRFWPNTVAESIAGYAPVFDVICIFTMLFIALVSLSHKEFRYKIFAYTTVYYLIYLIGVLLPTGGLKMNIGYSLFSYVMIITVLSSTLNHLEQEQKRLNLYGLKGILCYMPRASLCLYLFILAGIGLPVTPLFWNNFIIISEIFNYNLTLGILVILSMALVGLALLEELYRLKDKNNASQALIEVKDLSETDCFVYVSCLIILFFSFIKPLWFVF